MQNISTAQIAPLQNLASLPVTSFRYGGGRFEVSDKGVEFFGNKEGKEQPPLWICAPLHVVALTRDENSGDWGRMLEWIDDDRKKHQWAMPLELMEGDGSEVRRELAKQGLNISPNFHARNLLAAYIKVWPVDCRACCVNRLGWYRDVFVRPAESIGKSNELVVFQNAHAIEPAYSESGTTDACRDSVARLAQAHFEHADASRIGVDEQELLFCHGGDSLPDERRVSNYSREGSSMAFRRGFSGRGQIDRRIPAAHAVCISRPVGRRSRMASSGSIASLGATTPRVRSAPSTARAA